MGEDHIALLESYFHWLVNSGVSQAVTETIHIPIAGHVLGLNLIPHPRLDLEKDLERAMAYISAKKMSSSWVKNCRRSLIKFRHFLRQQRGLPDLPRWGQPLDLNRYHAGLPQWLLTEITRYQHLKQGNWRPSRMNDNARRFWSVHSCIFRWLLKHHPFEKVDTIKRRHIMNYLDQRLQDGGAISTINTELRSFQSILRYLQEQDYVVPQALLRLPGLKMPERLPRFLTDNQIIRLRNEMERQVKDAQKQPAKRDALWERAVFYLLWQGGLRLGEVEDLLLDELDLTANRLTVRQGKGSKDRTVFLTDRAVNALSAYLVVRGPGVANHVFLYHTRPLRKDIIRDRLKAAGRRVGVMVTPHQLRHTFATQLLNAGCRVTSLQRFLGHQRLRSTMTYAQVHNHTLAEDYYRAMNRIEQQLKLAEVDSEPDVRQAITFLHQLHAEPLTEAQQAAVTGLQAFILKLAEPTPAGISLELPVSAT